MVVELLNDLRPQADSIRALQKRPDVTTVHVSAFFQSDSAQMWFELPREVIRGLRELGTDLDIHIISWTDEPYDIPTELSAPEFGNLQGLPPDREAAWDMTGSFTLSVRGVGVDFGRPFDATSITDAVGLSPTMVRSDSYHGEWLHRRSFAVNDLGGRWDSDIIADALMRLLKDLGPNAASIRALNRRPDVTSFTIECRLRSVAAQMGYTLPIEAIDRLCELGVGITFHVHSGGMGLGDRDDGAQSR